MDKAIFVICFFGSLFKGATLTDALLIGFVAFAISYALLGGIFDSK